MAILKFYSILSLACLLLGTTFTPSHGEDDGSKFAYGGANGPENWGSLGSQYRTCSDGKSQSPVDIWKNQTITNQDLKPLTRNYSTVNATLVNTGHNIAANLEENAGFITLNEKKYSLFRMHWHTPSEHRIDGIQYQAELHLVHKADDGTLAVVGILYDVGNKDPLVADIENALKKLAEEKCGEGEEAQIHLGIIDLKDVRKSSRKYYRYEGSLTTPPCTQGVVWSILGKVRTITKEQLAMLNEPLAAPFRSNARPPQPLNGRKIILYDEFDV